MAEPWAVGRGAEFFDWQAQPKHPAYDCDLCGATLVKGLVNGMRYLETVATRDRYGFPIPTARCVKCGLVQQAIPMDPAGLRALYSGPYRALVSEWWGRPINAETLEPEQRAYGQELAQLIATADAHHFITRTSRVLDLGGSTGVVANTMTPWAHLTVIEPSPAEAAAAARRVNRVVVQSAEDFDPGDERYDLVLLCQTVDHLRSISGVLRKVRGLLAPGGRFYVDIVDWEAVRGEGPVELALKIDHIYSLTPATMEAYLARAGFSYQIVGSPAPNHVGYLCEAIG